MKTTKFILLFVFMAGFLFSQPVKFVWPLDSPCVLTGNYGELRPNHFHAGLDFATGGQVNQPVYCAAEGYVSRIKVSATGYGKCVYVTHPNGMVTLYGHLNSYSLKIAAIVEKEQFIRESFEVEIFPKPFTVFVRPREIIGLSGSTGSSTGPHLHFEVRDEKTEAPLNPLEHYRYEDVTKPIIQSLALYNLADTAAPLFYKSIKIIENGEGILLPEIPLLTVNKSNLGLAFSGFDKFTPLGSPNNIYGVKIYFDGKLVYGHKLSGIKFEDTRYINEYSEAKAGLKYQKCFLPTVYPKEFITKSVNKGRLILTDTNFHLVKLVVNDEYGNQNDVQFHIRATNTDNSFFPSFKSELYVNCTKNFILKKDKIYIKIPANTLFYSTPLVVEGTIETSGKIIILPSDVNLRSNVIIGFKVPDKHIKNKNKLVLKSGNSYYTPRSSNDSVYFSVKNFGWFLLEEDHKAPRIGTTLKSKKSRHVNKNSTLSFTITDALSGIGKYKLYLNNEWVLAEFDAKSDLLTYKFNEDSPRGKLHLRLEVEDRVGNKAGFECEINH